ncbi:MAG: L-methionine (R)-S-oxide reductase [Cocleimonas sp.]|jgi:L-methionine (R)-S-oxide reductase
MISFILQRYEGRVMILTSLKPKVESILLNKECALDMRLFEICTLLEKNVAYYNWVGFYFKNGNKNELKLGPYVGEPTDHTIIPFGKGICGQVAVSNENFIVPDVQAQDNYIACSIDVKSEIVIPIFVDGENIGQIDIDSNTPDPFSEKDELFLEFVANNVAKRLDGSLFKLS